LSAVLANKRTHYARVVKPKFHYSDFDRNFPAGKSWTHNMKVTDTNSDKSLSHEVSVKVADRHKSCHMSQKVKLVTPLSLGPNISVTVQDRCMVTLDHQ